MTWPITFETMGRGYRVLYEKTAVRKWEDLRAGNEMYTILKIFFLTKWFQLYMVFNYSTILYLCVRLVPRYRTVEISKQIVKS